MTINRTGVLARIAVVSAIWIGGQACANTTIVIPGGPFDLLNPFAPLPTVALNSAQTYDFTFSFAKPLRHDQWWIQVEASKSSQQYPLEVDLYSGDPGGAHNYIETSPLRDVATVRFTPTVGDYYAQIKPAYIVANNEQLSGVLALAIPEPATWSMLLAGFGALGIALRRRAAPTAGGSPRPRRRST